MDAFIIAFQNVFSPHGLMLMMTGTVLESL